jgi:ribosomal protein S18 acetylase RimI-like enzyme
MDLMAKISDKIKTHGVGYSGHLIKKKRKKSVQSIASNHTLMLRRASPLDYNEEKEVLKYRQMLREKWYRLHENMKETKMNGHSGAFIRIDFEGKGYLDFQEEDGLFYLIMVEVKPEFRAQGIATKLLDYFLHKVNNAKGLLDLTAFTDQGEMYLKHKIEQMLSRYKNIELAG